MRITADPLIDRPPSQTPQDLSPLDSAHKICKGGGVYCNMARFFSLFFFLIYFFIEGYLLYRILLFSVKPQHESAIVYIYPLPFKPPSRLPPHPTF